MAKTAELIGDGRSYGTVSVQCGLTKSGQVAGTIAGPGLEIPGFELSNEKLLRMDGVDRKIIIRDLRGSPARFVSPTSEWK